MTRELARINLPLSTYTSWIWKIDLHNLFHFLSLRMHAHAVREHGAQNQPGADIIKPIVPIAYQAFEDYRLKGSFLTRQDKLAIRALIGAADLDTDSEMLADIFPTSRELAEFKTKWADVLSEGE